MSVYTCVEEFNSRWLRSRDRRRRAVVSEKRVVRRGRVVGERDGDEAQMGDLVALLTPILWHTARAQRLDRDTAEDVVQTAWLALVRNASSIADPQAVLQWLIVSVRREAWRVVGPPLQQAELTLLIVAVVPFVMQVLPARKVTREPPAHLGAVSLAEAIADPGPAQVDHPAHVPGMAERIAKRQLGSPRVSADPPGRLAKSLPQGLQQA